MDSTAPVATGRVVVVNFVSMDGVIQSPLSVDEDPAGGFEHGGWVPPLADDTVDDFMGRVTVGAATLLFGRRTYEGMARAWSRADDGEPAIAAINRAPKVVASRSRPPLEWSNSRLLNGDLAAGVAALRRDVCGEIVVFGSGELVRGLAAADLVDEYRLLQFPLVLGRGKRMFDDRGQLARFALADVQRSGTGVAILTYVRSRA